LATAPWATTFTAAGYAQIEPMLHNRVWHHGCSQSSIESAGRRREGGEVLMDKIFLFLLIGLVGWWIVNMLGQGGYEQLFEAEPSGLDMIFGIVGTSASGYLYMSWTQ